MPSSGSGNVLPWVWTDEGHSRVCKPGQEELFSPSSWEEAVGEGLVLALELLAHWGMNGRHWRLHLKPVWLFNWHIAHWGAIIYMARCDAVFVLPDLTAMPQSHQDDQEPRRCHASIIWMSVSPQNIVFMIHKNLWSFSLPFYTLTETSNIIPFSLKLSCSLYLKCPHIYMLISHPYHTGTSLEMFSQLLTFLADVHIYHSDDLVSIFTFV